MTLWLTHRQDCFVYNDFEQVDGEWQPTAVVWRREEGRQNSYDRHIYAMSRDGLWGVSIAGTPSSAVRPGGYLPLAQPRCI
jgi:hypothetical protein